jgi:hypothetical protein
MDSNNGAYLLYPVDLPNDAASLELVHNFLSTLAARLNDATTTIDTTVANAARIIRVPGSLNAKGDSTPDRPHRRARLLSVPENPVTVEPELLASVVETKQESTSTNEPEPPKTAAKDVSADIEWIRQWLKEHGLEIRNDKTWNGSGHRWELEVCPFNPDHDRGEAWVCIMPSGARAAGCQHDSCTWQWSEIVASSNGLLHVGTRKLPDLTPLFFNRVAVPVEYEPAAPEPIRWMRFLNQLWPEDPESTAALQEFFGYVLSGQTDLPKIMLLIGPTRSGKGTIARVLAPLLGKGNAAGPILTSLGTNFGLSHCWASRSPSCLMPGWPAATCTRLWNGSCRSPARTC